jgi:hypothetical protein
MKITRVDFHSFTNKLQFEIVDQHCVHSSGAFSTLVSVKRFGNTAMLNIPVGV